MTPTNTEYSYEHANECTTTVFLDTDGVLKSLRNASEYCILADELGEKEGKETQC